MDYFVEYLLKQPLDFKNDEDLSLFIAKLIFTTSPSITSFYIRENKVIRVNHLKFPTYRAYDIPTFICRILKYIPEHHQVNIAAEASSFTQEEKEEALSIVFKEKTPLVKEIITLCSSKTNKRPREQARDILNKLDSNFPLLKGEDDPETILYLYSQEKKNAFLFEKEIKEEEVKEKLSLLTLIHAISSDIQLNREIRNSFVI